MEEIKKTEAKESQLKSKKKNGKRTLLVLAFVILIAMASYVSLRGSYLQILEIGENYIPVFWKNITYKAITIGANFVFLFFVFYFTNRGIKKGLQPFFEQENKKMPKLPNKSIAFIISILVSVLTSGIIMQKGMLMFSNARFGIGDPIFNQDLSFYFFQKPFMEFMLLYFTIIVVGLTVYAAIYYIITFNLCFDGIDRETLKKSKLFKQLIRNIKIVVILIALLTLMSIFNLGFDKMMTIGEKDNTVSIEGAGLTEVTIKLWGYVILAVVMVVSVFKAIHHFKQKETKKIIISLAVVPGYLLVLCIVMVGFQNIFVKPNELDKQKSYIEENIKATKNAYNINVEEKDIENSGTISLEQIRNNPEVLDNIAIVSEDVTLATLKEKQSNAKYYLFNNTQIGKYEIDGKKKLVYVSPREILTGSSVTYSNKTYEYTHGFGSVLTSATSTDSTGNLEYIQKNFDGSDEKVEVTEPRIYFGMETNEPVVTNSKNKKEYDYPTSDSENSTNTYEGEAGLTLNFWDRLILGISKGNLNLAFSSEVTKDSKILVNRNIIERAKKLMPYIVYDENPYQVITEEGRLVWVIDGYTISNKYPYSQETMIEVNGEKQKINYIRNSVKVLVDSYDGTIKFYITDRTDPIIMAYRNMYPDLFQEKENPIPEDIASHIVYPKFLYTIQAGMLERYHNVKTDVLYRGNDVWAPATHTTSKTLKTLGTPIEPYYTMVKTIDKEEEQLGLVLPYTIAEKQSLISYLVGSCEEDSNGKLTLYKFSADSNVLGPMQLDTQIEQDVEISKAIQALSVAGTNLIRNMIIVPIDDTLLYVEPIYQIMLNDEEVPVLKKIIVASGNKVAMGDNLQDALSNLSSQYAINIEVSNTDTVEDLIEAIVKANQNLEKSNSNSDWEMIGKDIASLQELIRKLETLLEQEKEEEEKNGKITNTVVEENGIDTENTINTVD